MEVGISTLTVIAEPKCHKFWVTLTPAASKPGSISLRHKLGLQQNAASQTKPQLVNVTINALRKDETIPVLTQIQSTLESKVTFSFRWAEVAEQHTAHQNIRCSCCLSAFFPPFPGTDEPKFLSSKSCCLSPSHPFCQPETALQPLGRHTPSHHKPSLSHLPSWPPAAHQPWLGTWPQSQGPYTLAQETLLQTSCAVANYCWLVRDYYWRGSGMHILPPQIPWRSSCSCDHKSVILVTEYCKVKLFLL